MVKYVGGVSVVQLVGVEILCWGNSLEFFLIIFVDYEIFQIFGKFVFQVGLNYEVCLIGLLMILKYF